MNASHSKEAEEAEATLGQYLDTLYPESAIALIRLRVSSTFRHGIDVQTDLNHLADVVNAGVILKLMGAE